MIKRMIAILALITGSIGFEATAQVHVSINIGSQPLWGPVGYDRADYYYMPDIDAYYNVPQRQFIYLEGPRWIFASSLPARYGNYDLYHGYKVVINEPRPWIRNNVYRARYAGYRGNRGQAFIRDSRDTRYYKIKGHPYYGNGNNGNGHRNNGNGHGNNGNGHGNNGNGNAGNGHGNGGDGHGHGHN